MLNSSRINNSPRTNNTNLYNNINETANGLSRTFIQPKITSTPLVKRDSIFATPPKHNILSPRRYSLSEIATPPRSNRCDLSKTVKTGPLLASTGYNLNVSTYEDTKSPGLVSRIVQYNEETEREYSRPPTHQAKYGSPGLFPVVHLFKKKLPVLEQKPRRVTIRIATPEYSRHHSQEYNRKLLEGIVKPTSPINKGSHFSPTTQSSSSTRSVLDALKEISRKRIHASEEYDLNEDSGKRLRTMTNADGNKRQREDSPLDKSPSPSKPISKKVCMYDEYAASCSSTDFSFKKAEDPGPKRKSISISTLTDNPKEAKQVKLINAETQTIANETTETAEPDQQTPKENGTDDSEGEVPIEKKKSPLKVFNDAPLERIRKNRLAALMGSLTGKEPVLVPKPDYSSMLDSQEEASDTLDSSSSKVPKSTERTLVSILSSPKKLSPTKSNKHVHFSVPESTSQTNFGSTTSVPSFPATPISSAITVTVSSVAETHLTFSSRSTPAPPSSPVALQVSSSSASTALPIISFSGGNTSNSSSTTSVLSKESSTSSVAAEAPKTGFVIPNFQFNSSAPSVSPAAAVSSSESLPLLTTLSAPSASAAAAPPVVSAPHKMGGFKFDLSKPVTTTFKATTSTVPTFSFGGAAEAGTAKVTSELAVSSSASIPSNSTFSFGSKPADSATTSAASVSFGTTTTSSTSPFGVLTTSASPAPTFKFGPVGNENKTAGLPLAQSNATTFGVNKDSTTSVPAFATSTTAATAVAPTTSAAAFGTSKAPFFGFGPPKTTSPASGFGPPANTTSAISGFAAPARTTSSDSGFGVPASTTPAVSFGTASATSASFGTPTNNFLNSATSLPAPNFGATVTSPTLSGGFGSPSTTLNPSFSSNTTPMFGASKTASPFAASTAATSAFGKSSAATSSTFGKTGNPQFGQSTTQSSFGTPTTTVSFCSANSFGVATATTASSVFGSANSSPSVFGAKTGGFGAPSTNSNIFGGPVNSQPSGFGAPASKPMFGSSAALPFGSTTKTTTAPSFGNTATPSFNFVGKTTTSSSFGSTNSFGNTTAASAGFGNPTASSFGTSNSFSGSNFGNANAFGGSSAPTFGAATTSSHPSGFGATTTPTFGNSNANFNASDKNSAFGSSTAFGNTISSPFGSSTSTPSFGPANSVSGFGTSTAASAFAKPPVSQNTFGAPTSNTFRGNGNFGNTQSQTPGFGATNTSNNQNAVFSFAATTPPKPPGIFSFGSGASNEVPKPSFNFTGGVTSPPAFGSSASPSFGSGGAPPPFGATGIPQFNAPQAAPQGMFSIGSGTSTGKSRTHLKPKRRI